MVACSIPIAGLVAIHRGGKAFGRLCSIMTSPPLTTGTYLDMNMNLANFVR